MSAWQLVNAYSGLSADLVKGEISFAPKLEGDYRLFWSAGTAFGTLTSKAGKVSLDLLGGSLSSVRVLVNGQAIASGAQG